MKMTASEQHLLLELADLELAARIDPAELPERAALETLRAQRTELRDGAAASSMSVQDIQRRIHAIDEDLKKLSKRQQADADELARYPEDPGLRRELHRDLEQTQRRIDNKLAEKDELLKRCDAQRLNTTGPTTANSTTKSPQPPAHSKPHNAHKRNTPNNCSNKSTHCAPPLATPTPMFSPPTTNNAKTPASEPHDCKGAVATAATSSCPQPPSAPCATHPPTNYPPAPNAAPTW